MGEHRHNPTAQVAAQVRPGGQMVKLMKIDGLPLLLAQQPFDLQFFASEDQKKVGIVFFLNCVVDSQIIGGGGLVRVPLGTVGLDFADVEKRFGEIVAAQSAKGAASAQGEVGV